MLCTAFVLAAGVHRASAQYYPVVDHGGVNGLDAYEVEVEQVAETPAAGDMDVRPEYMPDAGETGSSEIDPLEVEDENAPVDLTADDLQHDEQSRMITASGNVELVQAGRILKADRIVYDLAADEVMAIGNVVLMEPNGDVHFADEVRLKHKMKQGFVRGLQSYLAEGGHFTAAEGHRVSDTIITMRDASYTPCECETNESGDPAWNITAKEVTYDKESHKITYRDAKFEIFGVPVFYTPYLVHSDGKIKRKSGLLIPSVGYDSDLGAVLTQNYYWNIAPNRDATFGMMAASNAAPVALGEYRHRFRNARVNVRGSATYSDRQSGDEGISVRTDKEWRGHLFGNGLWDINEKWRAGFGVELASDDQYLRQYDFSSKDVLENEIYTERFSGRNYTIGRLLAFQDVRVSEQTDQPDVLPEVYASFMGEPNALFKGRWHGEFSALGLQRDDGQDMQRVIGELGWQRRAVLDFGLVNTLDASLRGDLYYVTDRDVATPGSGRSGDATEARIFPRLHLVSSYPVTKPFEKSQAIIEPIVSLTVSPDIESDDDDIPNEDSRDAQIDASNLFRKTRFPGRDRIEDKSHVTYGARAGLYGYDGSFADVFLGQSYRFDEDDNPFPRGSGLSRQESDYVGQINGRYKDAYGMNYRFQLDSEDGSSQRHELDGYANMGRVYLSTRYLFAKGLEGTDITESREQVRVGAAFDATENWRLRGDVLHDLGEDPGLREATLGVDYFGCCLNLSVVAHRENTSEASGESGTEVIFRLGLKGLGEFSTGNTGSWSANTP